MQGRIIFFLFILYILLQNRYRCKPVFNLKSHYISLTTTTSYKTQICFYQFMSLIKGIPTILPNEEESVLLGAAILGASASNNFSNIQVFN